VLINAWWEIGLDRVPARGVKIVLCWQGILTGVLRGLKAESSEDLPLRAHARTQQRALPVRGASGRGEGRVRRPVKHRAAGPALQLPRDLMLGELRPAWLNEK